MKSHRWSNWWAWALILVGIVLVRRRKRVAPARDTSLQRAPESVGWRLYSTFFARVNGFVAWHRMPRWIGLANLFAFRHTLRERNLHDVSLPGAQDQTATPFKQEYLTQRTQDGSWNDLCHPGMGAGGQRFGRNFPKRETRPEPQPRLLEPNPRLISERLLKRDEFKPAESLNLLAAAWIQFQVHDWFSHGEVDKGSYFTIPIPPGDQWPVKRGQPQPKMQIPRTRADAHPSGSGDPPAYVNELSHWWDATAIYGVREETTNRLRGSKDGTRKGLLQDGKMIVPDDRRLPIDPFAPDPADSKKRAVRSGHVDNWWLGLALLHTLFTREHNAICDRLRAEYPGWEDERIFQTAKLILAALTAKIHTVEWTTAILQHPVLKIAMNANWWGLATEAVHKIAGRLSSSDALSGIPGSALDHHGVPYALTEEFVSVYRLHPLIPDEVTIRSLRDGRALKKDLPLPEIAFEKAAKVVDCERTPPGEEGGKVTLADVFYSFGIAHPGAMTLHNYPNTLREIEVPANRDDPIGPKRLLDLAATDITRDRERGVPRYNRFRELLHMKPARSFREITPNPAWARELAEIYGGDVDRVDLLVGMLAENPPEGFGFSDTAFRIFILMASRRLKSDRFFTTDYRPEIYTRTGMDWIENNDMTSVLLRHY
ncbi:MAG: peroxidase, partial [Verrucomicrobiota bacterium]|nr:peroxidase [Verrucomicrobiota bacterium]